MSDEETEQDMFMYVLEAMAYISASLAAIIYIWDTCFKEFKKRKIRRNDNRDLEMGLTPISENQEDYYSSGSNTSSPEISPSQLRYRSS